MKKAFMITGIAYMAISTTVGLWMMFNPEAYGEYTGKFLTGFCNVMEKIEERRG